MESLTDRAERAVLGALITDPDHVTRLSYLMPDDFADPRHQAVFAGLTRAVDVPGLSREQWHATVALADSSQITTRYVRELAAACPDAAHADAYGAMVIQARLARQLARRASELDLESAELGRDARHVLAVSGTSSEATGNLAVHLGKVAAAFREHAARLSTTRGGPGLEPPWAQRQPAETVRVPHEERVLSALLQGHPESNQVISFLPVAAFTGEHRQELFQAIRSLSRAGTPVDALTVDWELSQRSAQPAPRSETYTTRLANTVPGTDSLLRDANALLADLQRRASSPVPPAPSLPAPSRPAVAPIFDAPAQPLRLVQPPGVAMPRTAPEQRT